MDSKEKLSGLTIALHWIIAITVIVMINVGFYMATFEVWALYPIHKAIGVIIFTVILVRVVWRLKNGWPTPIRDYPAWEHKLAVTTHWVLILGTIIMPISGFIFSGAGGYGVDVFGWILVRSNHNPANLAEVIPFNKAISEVAHEIHEIVGILLAIALILHIAGALKHHIIDKDRTLLRMLGK